MTVAARKHPFWCVRHCSTPPVPCRPYRRLLALRPRQGPITQRLVMRASLWGVTVICYCQEAGPGTWLTAHPRPSPGSPNWPRRRSRVLRTAPARPPQARGSRLAPWCAACLPSPHVTMHFSGHSARGYFSRASRRDWWFDHVSGRRLVRNLPHRVHRPMTQVVPGFKQLAYVSFHDLGRETGLHLRHRARP